MKREKYMVSVIILALFFGLTFSLSAQTRAKCLADGVVYDRCNQPVVGATVTARYPDGRIFSAISVQEGYYGPGTYAIGVSDYPEYADIWASYNGWQSLVTRVYGPFPQAPVNFTMTQFHDLANCLSTIESPALPQGNDSTRAQALLRGRIYNRNCSPLVGATVYAMYPDGTVGSAISTTEGWYGNGSYALPLQYGQPIPEYIMVWATYGTWKSQTIKVCYPAPEYDIDRIDLQTRYRGPIPPRPPVEADR